MYIPPELAQIGNYTYNTDLYSIGLILHEFLSGSQARPLRPLPLHLNTDLIWLLASLLRPNFRKRLSYRDFYAAVDLLEQQQLPLRSLDN